MLRKVLICFVFSICCFLNTWVELAQGEAAYSSRYSPWTGSAGAVVLMQVVVAGAALSIWLLLDRMREPSPPLTATIVFLASLVPLGIGSVAILRILPFDATTLVRQRWFWPLALLVTALVAVPVLRHIPRLLLHAPNVLLYSWPVLAVILLQASSATLLRYPAADYDDGALAPRSGTVPKRRVVWIVFDELSQTVVFDQRPAHLSLPNFDRLRNESFCALAAHAPATNTLESIPSLVLGERVTKAETRGPRSLFVYTQRRLQGFEWGSETNVFDRARELMRADAAVVGWFHPYGRLLNRSLAACFWTAGWLLSGVEEPLDRVPLSEAVGHRLRSQISVMPLLGHIPGWNARAYQREQTIARFQRLLEKSRAAAADPSFGIVFLHLPVPHPPPIYSRREAKMMDRGANNYFDNVALADWTLGELRQSIERAGLADNTTLVVTSDHGWRALWRGGADWTAEEEAQFRNSDASTVPFLVRLPGSHAAVAFHERVNTTVTGALVLRMLGDDVRSPEDVARFVRAARH